MLGTERITKMKKTNLQFEKHLKGDASMRTLAVFSALSLVLLFCAACTKSGAPSCTDESVKKLVLDISTKEFRNQLAGNVYDYLNEMKDKPGNDSAKETISYVDKQIAEAKISLANIRINKKRDDIKKCECGGDLAFSNGKTLSITYTAQFTEDGKVYVEVAGLKQGR